MGAHERRPGCQGRAARQGGDMQTVRMESLPLTAIRVAAIRGTRPKLGLKDDSPARHWFEALREIRPG